MIYGESDLFAKRIVITLQLKFSNVLKGMDMNGKLFLHLIKLNVEEKKMITKKIAEIAI
jgi:hypothetical protein